MKFVFKILFNRNSTYINYNNLKYYLNIKFVCSYASLCIDFLYLYVCIYYVCHTIVNILK